MKTFFSISTVVLGLFCSVLPVHGYAHFLIDGGHVSASSNARQLLEDARGGDVDAMRQLGKHLIDGTVMRRDIKNGVLWLKKAVEAGDDRSMLLLGDLYHQGRGVSQNDKKAVELYMQAAAAGNKNTTKRLEKMPMKYALPWWETQATAGSKKAVLKLMRAYATGEGGVRVNDEKAVEWYLVATKKWPKAAEKTLAEMPDAVKTACANAVASSLSSEECGYLLPYPLTKVDVQKCLSSYYNELSEEECRKKYLSELESTRSTLVSLAVYPFHISYIRRIIHAYASAELHRIVLIHKYKKTPDELLALDKEIRAQILSKMQDVAMVVNTENPAMKDLQIVKTLCFMTNGWDNKSPQEYKSSAEELYVFFLLMIESDLSKITSSENGSNAMQASFYAMMCWQMRMLLAADKPEVWQNLKASSDYKSASVSIAAHCNRIENNRGYGNAGISEDVLFVRKGLDINKK